MLLQAALDRVRQRERIGKTPRRVYQKIKHALDISEENQSVKNLSNCHAGTLTIKAQQIELHFAILFPRWARQDSNLRPGGY